MTTEPDPKAPEETAPAREAAHRAFSTRLVNPPNRDPALLVGLVNSAHDYLFDCGTLNRLSNHDKLRIKRVFITHAHIDHTIGLDQLLRSLIYRPESLEIYGPQGILEQVYHRLQSYAWNLTGDSPFQVRTYELLRNRLLSQTLECSRQFQPSEPPREGPAPHSRLELPEGPTLSWLEVAHGVPCLAYTLQWPRQWSFLVELARADGLEAGPWVRELKEKFAEGLWDVSLRPGSTDLRCLSAPGNESLRSTVGALGQRYLSEHPGGKLAYVTDTLLGADLSEQLREFVRGSDELWCESNYLQRDLELADQNLHATVSQAAQLARSAEVESLRLFHISRRYAGLHQEHLEEAQRIFPHSQIGA